MAPSNNLFARYYSHCDLYGNCYTRSRWDSWGRWVLLGVVIVCFLIALLLCAFTARRRRRRGTQPFLGTGWMAPQGGKTDANNDPNSYQMNNNQGYGQQGYNQGGYNPPPAYGQQQPQYTGTTFNPNDGYYGNQQYGGVQQPPNTYSREAGGDYAPPAGAPPGK